MHVDEAIRGRRTLKAFATDAVPREAIEELLALAVHAPNHHRTEPWRFVVLGAETIERLATATGDGKLRRSPTAIVVGQQVAADAGVAEEDYAACAAAVQNVMLAARARDLAAFWRTPSSLATPEARALLGLEDDVRAVGIVHVGRPQDGFPQEPPTYSAAPFTRWLP